MECLEPQLNKFPEAPEEVEEDIDRVVAEFYRNELEENKALERAVDRIYSEEDYDEVDKENFYFCLRPYGSETNKSECTWLTPSLTPWLT